jgi:hypothetical protein
MLSGEAAKHLGLPRDSSGASRLQNDTSGFSICGLNSLKPILAVKIDLS